VPRSEENFSKGKIGLDRMKLSSQDSVQRIDITAASYRKANFVASGFTSRYTLRRVAQPLKARTVIVD
jgi:hypothetical protein